PDLPGLDIPTVDAAVAPPPAPRASSRRLRQPPPPLEVTAPTEESPAYEPGADSERLLAEGRRKRAERRLKSDASGESEEDIFAGEPFPWLLVLAGAGAALVIVLALWLLLGGVVSPAPPPPPPPPPATEPPPAPERSPARRLADELIERAHRAEASSDLETAYLAVDLPTSS